jgi:hypothetical protein
VWLDGADPVGTGVRPANGTSLTTWKDKSISNFPITSAGSSYNTTAVNGLPGINISTNPFVYNPGSAQNNWQELFAIGLWTGGSTFNTYNGFITSCGENDNQLGGGIIFIGDLGTTNWYNITAFQTPFLNGIQTNTALPTIQSPFCIRTHSTSAVNVTGLQLGVDRTNGRNWVGFISEVIIYNTALTTSQRQQVEGYLAHKWGLSLSIPSTHPFYSIRPHLRGFQPNDIDGCQLWLDAADQSSLVLSGSNVTTWRDKSGNGYHMNIIAGSIYWSGTPAYPTIGTSINGLQTVKFVAQSGLKQATTLDGVKNLFWVGRIAAPDGSGTQPYYFLLGHDSAYSWCGEPYGEGFVYPGVAEGGITSASASLFTNDANAVTNATFSSVIMPSAPNVSLLSVSGITGSTPYQGICYDRDIHIGWCGDLAEVLIFSTALTTSQRQQVEGYLAHKWGLTPYLPLMSPLSIPGCSLWLDGADPAGTGTPPANGATVSTWVDKASGKNAAATGTPTYLSGGGINFNASPYFLNQTFSMNLSQRSIFIVMQETSRNTGAGVIPFIPTPSSGSDYNTTGGLAIETASGLRFLGNYGGSPGSYLSALGNTNLLVKAIYNDTMNVRTGSGYLNGTNTTNVTADYTASTCSGYVLGGRWELGSVFGSSRLNGVIYEIIVFNTPLTTFQRQNIEGYLARKWGISTSATLPSTHPFKSITPASLPFSPRNISGVALWLDAADTSSMTLSGSSVTQWRDKSGSSNHFTPTSGTPTSILDNGRSVVNFTSGTIMTSANQITFTTSSAFFIVSRLTSISTNGLAMLLTFTNIANAGGNLSDFSIRFSSSGLYGTAAQPGNFQDIANRAYYVNGTFDPSFGSSTYLNVYSMIGIVSPITSGTSFLTLSSSFSSRFYVGNIAEFLYYPGGVTSSQRQTIEGYLAHKWGLTESLPSTHPFKKFPPA